MNACFRSLLFTGFFVLFLSHSFTIALASPYGSGDYSTSSYNGEAPTPTSTPAPAVEAVSNAVNSVSSVLGSWTRTAEAPRSAPDLFEVDTLGTQAIIYFSPAQRPYTEYYVSFGDGLESEGYGAGFQLSQTSGALKYDVYHLKPNMNYTFKVRAGNDCKAGPWSSTMTVKTGAKGAKRLAKFYPKKQAVNTYKAPSLASKALQKTQGAANQVLSAVQKALPKQKAAKPAPTKAPAKKPAASR